jgi:hypothetical protein
MSVETENELIPDSDFLFTIEDEIENEDGSVTMKVTMSFALMTFLANVGINKILSDELQKLKT